VPVVNQQGFRQEALQSLKLFRGTGHYLTGPEVREWLRFWGTDEENGIGPCHE